MRAVQITRFGGPEVLEIVDVPDPTPAPGQQLYDVSTAGINYADTHQVEDSYLSKTQLPLVPGSEVVGTTPDLGSVKPLMQPLRTIAAQISRRMAAAQTVGAMAGKEALVRPAAAVLLVPFLLGLTPLV